MDTSQNNHPQIFELWQLPSPTTVVFLLICVVGLMIIFPQYPMSVLFIFVMLGLFVFILMASIRLFLQKPKKIINRDNLQPIKNIDPEISQVVSERVKYWSDQIGLKNYPQILVTNSEHTIETIGTFKYNYIIFNFQQLEKIYRADNNRAENKLLDVILIHELGHIYSGDNWKTNLSKEITRNLMVFSLFLLIFSFFNKAELQSILLGSPVEKSNYIYNIVSFPIIILTLRYIISILSDSHEILADQIGNIINHDYSSNFVKAITSVFNSEPIYGNAFIGRTGLNERFCILSTGNYPINIQRKILILGGIVIGIPLYYFYEGGGKLLSLSLPFSGLILGLYYLLPLFYEEVNKGAVIKGWQIINAALLYFLGVFSILVFRTISALLIYKVNAVHHFVIEEFIFCNIQICFFLSLYCIELFFALAISLQSLRWYSKSAQLNRLPKGKLWFLLTFVIAMGSMILVVFDTFAKLLIPSIFPWFGHFNWNEQLIPLIIALLGGLLTLILVSFAYCDIKNMAGKI
jgi:hypothetical protein